MITFPENSQHILGVTLGQSGQFADGVTKTEMEQGAAKVRVRESKPAFLASVSVLCTYAGRGQIMEFYLVDAQQGANYFKWPCLHGFETDVLMKFAAPPSVQEKIVSGVGLHEITFSLVIREIPNALLAEVMNLAGSTAEFEGLMTVMDALTLQPELDEWAGIELVA
ncbi:MAG: hypothetical protein COC24_019220 [Alphaproteobacteria bacterium]|nr:hypothetical protein [Alphaproteobacteria bacterium]